MNLNKNYILLFLFIVGSFLVSSQNIDGNKKQREELEEVIVTGQINPQSVNKAVFEVKVIGRREIEKRAGVNLADLLNQTLNLNIVPNLATGRSEISLFGLDGQYVKVLVNNVPLINEGGFGNGVDLSLINLDNVERIEIVEGAMGVQYGSNAVSGVINIITKKSSRFDTEVSLSLQEETIGDEYNITDKGRHIQTLRVRKTINEKIFASLGILRNKYSGFYNDKLGELHDKNDGLRGHEWFPKEQINPNLLFNYDNGEGFTCSYKFDYFHENIFRYNKNVNLNLNPATDTSNPSALDDILTSNRFIHTVYAAGTLKNNMKFRIVNSYQKQRNDVEKYIFFIRSGSKNPIYNREYLSRSIFFTRTTLSNIFQTKKFNMQAGFEGSSESGYTDNVSIGVGDNSDQTASQTLNNYDVFISTEYNFSKRFTLRPEVRTSITNLYGPQHQIALSSMHKFDNDLEFRTNIGTSNKTPTYNELYYYFVDSNHNVQGDPNLKPEKGYSISAHLKKAISFQGGLRLKPKFSVLYLNLTDKIDVVQISFSPNVSKFKNIDTQKTFNVSFTNEIKYNRFSANLGVSLQGISRVLGDAPGASDAYLYNFSSNINLNYVIPTWNSSITLFYKFRGTEQRFVFDSESQQYILGKTNPISWLDLNLEKSFSDRKFIITLGARNLLDIDFAPTNALPAGAHSPAPNSIGLAYGRSFLLKLNYNLNI